MLSTAISAISKRRPPPTTADTSCNEAGPGRMRRSSAVRKRTSVPSAREHGQRGREPVQEAPASNRPDLARSEEPRRRRAAELTLDRLGVVVAHAEHRAAPTVARKQERARRPAAGDRLGLEAERAAKVLVGGASVSGMEAHDL